MATTGKSPKECGVCHEEFDSMSRCPRIFNCFHSFCTHCINQLIKNNNKKCPFCRTSFVANNARDVTVNHTMLEFMNYMLMKDINSKRPQKGRVFPRKRKLDDLKTETQDTSRHHLSNCQKAQKQIEKLMKDVLNLQRNITLENYRINNDILPKIHNIVAENNMKGEKLENIHKQLSNKLDDVLIKNKQLEDTDVKLETCAANTYKEIAPIIDEADDTNTAISEWMENLKELLSEDERSLQTTDKEIKRTKETVSNILEVLSSPGIKLEEINPFPGLSVTTRTQATRGRSVNPLQVERILQNFMGRRSHNLSL